MLGPAPEPPPPHTYGSPSAEKPAARPAATAGFGAVIFWPASAADTYGLFGIVTVGAGGQDAATPVAAVVEVPPPVEPKYLRNR